jgi:hypothetical protein
MRFPVDLNRQPCVAAEEVEHIGPGGVLPAKLEAARSSPKPMPEDHLRKGHLAPQMPRISRRARSRLWREILQHWRHPSTVLRTVPLPEASSGRIWLFHAPAGPPPRSGEEL